VESYGVSMGARSSGLGQTANGFGKIIGPLSLAVIAGTSNLVSPQATAAAVFPAFLFLAFCMALVGLSFLLLRVETHGKPMAHGARRRGLNKTAIGALGQRRATDPDPAGVLGPVEQRRGVARRAAAQRQCPLQHEARHVPEAFDQAVLDPVPTGVLEFVARPGL